MLVHLSNRHCNCCGIMVETSIIDIPVQEVKLAPFAVACKCGYFYEAIHYTVSFRKWQIAKSEIGFRLDNAQSDYNREKEFINTYSPVKDYMEIELKRKEELVLKLHAQWDEISLTPIPDHRWDESKLS